ncbi:hypothetical protein [Oerskovia flava]|uniref:hypothetical protein n=1 Tax=Oerskovia flava TaxID=2986422 RepID=UPI00223F22E9|nr:hypothetical protein [Oerskovia sp. JB1-3-2]
MTQTAAPPVPASAPDPGPAGARRIVPAAATPARTSRRARLRASMARTPGRMRIALAVSVLAAIAFGLLGFQAASVQARALTAAEHDTSQLVDIQEARNTLVVADAIATNAFLVGGLEPTAQRERFDEAVLAATTLLTELAGRNAADSPELATAQAGLSDYVRLVEQARANNRQGFPVGSAYLDQASTTLRDETLPALDGLVVANADRVATDFAGVRNALWILAAGLLALAVLVLVQVWLARRTHRVLNVGLVAASAVVLVIGIGGAVVLGQASSTANAVRAGPYAATLASSQAYSLANDAKSMESFTLIKRGSGQAYEEEFVASVTEAGERLDTAAAEGVIGDESSRALDEWVAQHELIRELDDGGDWDGAVALAIGDDADSPNAAFDAFSAQVRDDIAQSTTQTQDRLSSAQGLSAVSAWLLLLAGGAAALLAWRGMSARLEEYR